MKPWNIHPAANIAYMIWMDKVVILAVAHAKRRPYYWHKRICEARKMF